MTRRTIDVSLLLPISLLALAGCVGDDEGDAEVVIAYDKALIEETFFHGQAMGVNALQSPQASFRVTVSSSLAPSDHVRVVDPGGFFLDDGAEVIRRSAQQFDVSLLADTQHPVGHYAGRLKLNVCRDPGCLQTYSVHDGGLPYSVDIRPQLRAEVYIAGVLVGSVVSGQLPIQAYSGAANQQIEIKSTVPMTVDAPSNTGAYEWFVSGDSSPVDWSANLQQYSDDFTGTYVTVTPTGSARDVEKPVTILFEW